MTLNLKNDKVVKNATQLRVQTYDNIHIYAIYQLSDTEF